MARMARMPRMARWLADYPDPTEVWSKNSSFSDLKTAHDMLFTTSTIWQYPEVYEDEIQEWIEYATVKRIMIGVRSQVTN